MRSSDRSSIQYQYSYSREAPLLQQVYSGKSLRCTGERLSTFDMEHFSISLSNKLGMPLAFSSISQSGRGGSSEVWRPLYKGERPFALSRIALRFSWYEKLPGKGRWFSRSF